MRKLISFAFMAVLMTMVGPLQAQDVTGTWTLTYSQMGRQGGQAREVSMDVTLAQEGASVTGTALVAMQGRPGGAGRAGGGQPQEIPIADGKVEGDQLTFSMVRGQGERTMTMVFTSTVAGSEMAGQMTMSGGMGAREPIPFKGVKKEG
jgi:hypothetical protein